MATATQATRPADAKADRVVLLEDFDRLDPGWTISPSKLRTTCIRDGSMSYLRVSWRQAPETVYLFHKLTSPPAGDVLLRVRLRLTTPARYVAVGWLDKRGRFQHIKLRHPVPGKWETLVVRVGTVLGWLNGMDFDDVAARPRTLRILVTGLREPNGAIDVDRVELLSATGSACDAAGFACDANVDEPAAPPRSAAGLRTLHAALRSWPPAIDTQRARLYRDSGCYQFVYPGRAVRPPADWDRATPPTENPTEMFLWHALDPIHFLLQAWWDSGDQWYLRQAAYHADRWLARYLEQDRFAGDKYTWYDHAAAYRAIELTALYRELAGRDEYAELSERVRRALCLHAELLSSPGFVAWNQPARYHNHAAYQAVALVVLGAYVPDLPHAAALRELGLERIEAQITHLVNTEGAVVENALGYQLGMLRLSEAIADFLHASGLRRTTLDQTVERMRSFVTTVAYPDGTLPAYGDTWCGITVGPAYPQRTAIPDLAVYPDGGYAVLGGASGSLQLNFFTSAKTITHKHEDYLSLTCYWKRRWLIDPGYYDFSDNPHAEAARRATTHNVPLLPQYSYCLFPGAAKISDWGESADLRWVAGDHTAQAGFVVCRRVIVLKNQPLVFVEDWAKGQSEAGAAFEQWFHAAPDLTLTIPAAGEVLLSAPNQLLQCRVVQLSEGNVGITVFRGESEPWPIGWYYPAFAQARPAMAWRFRGTTDHAMIAAIVFEDCLGNQAQCVDRKILLDCWRTIRNSLRN